MIITRYPKLHGVTSHLNQMDDMIDWLGYLTSPEYLTDLLVARHGLSVNDAKVRAKKIIPHISAAISLIKQSLIGSDVVSFLPAYYAMLDLAKVYILLGPRHADLPMHRWHGASYDVAGKDSRTLLTELITLKRGGALALFYETLTGKPILTERKVKMRDVYPYIRDISAEYRIATNKVANLASIEFEAIKNKAPNSYQIQAILQPRNPGRKTTIACLAVFRDFKKAKGKDNTFVSPVFTCTPDQVDMTARQFVNCCFLCLYTPNSQVETFLTGRTFPMPEEFPIIILFFHMASVVRYKPELLERLQLSRYWPILANARRHSLLKFIILFWSYIHKEELIVEAA